MSAPDAATKLLYHDHVIAMVQVARTGFIIKCEIFVIWTVLLAGICWDIDLTTLLPEVVWKDECLHGRKFVSLYRFRRFGRTIGEWRDYIEHIGGTRN